MKKEIVEILERKFNLKDIKTRPGGFGKSLSYVQGHHVLGRLNEAFGGNYSIEILTPVDKAVIDNNIVVHVRITVIDENGNRIVRDGIGGKTMTNKDLVSNFKAGVTDAIKKVAATFGVALHLYGADEIEEGEDAPEAKVATKEEENVRVPISPNQIKAIETIARSKKVELKTILAENKVDNLERLTEGQAKVIIDNLQKVK